MRRMIQKEISSCQKLSHTQIRIKRWVGSFFSDKLSLSNQIHADHNNSIRPYLLAGTIGAFHNKLDESAFSLCFGCKTSYRPGIGATICRNIKGNRSVLSEEECLEISYAMIKNQMRKASDAQSLWEKIQPVYQSCHQVAIGQLIAIGIAEEKLDQHVYSCFAGGSPTGKLLSDLIRKPLEQNTVQVRIILDNQIMEDPSVEIVNIMDEKEVQEYCQHHSFQQEEIEQALEHLCKREQSMQKEESIEKAALTQIKEIQTKILEALSSL